MYSGNLCVVVNAVNAINLVITAAVEVSSSYGILYLTVVGIINDKCEELRSNHNQLKRKLTRKKREYILLDT